VGELSLLVPMAGLIEPADELQRLDKRLQKIEQELNKSRAKLAVDSFVASAPVDVVEQERTRLAERERERAALLRQIEQVRKLSQEPT
jgi:valyl-tRNA synthetase